MNIFQRFKRWISPLFSSIDAKEESASLGGIERSQSAYLNTKIYGDGAEQSPLQRWYEAQTQVTALKIIQRQMDREDRKRKINEEIKNLQLSIAVAKKQKKKHSHLLHEMAVLKSEVLRMESM